MSDFYRDTLWLAANTMPSYQLTGSDLHILASNNIPMLVRMVNDPLVIKRTRIDTIYGMVHLMDTAYTRVPDVHAPVLLLYGSKDEVIPRAAIEHALKRFYRAGVCMPIIPTDFNMLLRDIQGQRVMEDMLKLDRTSG